jgi:hypothetical protein
MAIGKRTKAVRTGIDRDKAYTIVEAVKLVKERAKAKFDETIEIAMNLGVDPKHADQMVRGVVTLPNGSGRTVRVGVFARGAKADEAKAAGADVVGARIRRFPLFVGAGNRQNLLAPAQPVREHDRAADHLVGVLGIDAEAKRDLDGFVELRELHLLHQGNRLFDRVRTIGDGGLGRREFLSGLRHV